MAIAGTSQLALYNGALAACGDRQVASVSENSEARRIVDLVYTPVLEWCLGQGFWTFAKRTVKLDADTGITPEFGPANVFAKPTDWVRTIALSADENFTFPLTTYLDEANRWLADLTPLYVSYVSNDNTFGLDLTRWPQNFVRFAELAIADRIAKRLGVSQTDRDEIKTDLKKAKLNALTTDAMNEAQPRFKPLGSWNAARRGSGRGERGNTSRLIG